MGRLAQGARGAEAAARFLREAPAAWAIATAGGLATVLLNLSVLVSYGPVERLLDGLGQDAAPALALASGRFYPSAEVAAGAVGAIALAVVGQLLLVVVVAFVTSLAMAWHRGEQATLGSGLRSVGHRAGPLALWWLVASLAALVQSLAVVLPGQNEHVFVSFFSPVWLLLTAFVVPAIMIRPRTQQEGSGGMVKGALSALGTWWPVVLGLFLVLLMAMWAAGALVLAIASAVPGNSGPALGLLVLLVLGALVLPVLTAFQAAFLALLYEAGETGHEKGAAEPMGKTA